jgi:hypothetical protein
VVEIGAAGLARAPECAEAESHPSRCCCSASIGIATALGEMELLLLRTCSSLWRRVSRPSADPNSCAVEDGVDVVEEEEAADAAAAEAAAGCAAVAVCPFASAGAGTAGGFGGGGGGNRRDAAHAGAASADGSSRCCCTLQRNTPVTAQRASGSVTRGFPTFHACLSSSHSEQHACATSCAAAAAVSAPLSSSALACHARTPLRVRRRRGERGGGASGRTVGMCV